MRSRVPRGVGVALLAAACGSQQRFAELGAFRTEGGDVIQDCRLGYRTFGRLDGAGSNAVLFLPWFQGTSRELAWQVGPTRLVDSSRFYVIAVDAFGNGVSSSPSNSPSQPGDRFPPITLRDMVRAEHELVTRVLGIAHLKAVVGVSMGGMQALAWSVTYPDAMDEVVSIVGSPRATERDRARWREAMEEVATRPAWRRALDALKRGGVADALRALRIPPSDHRAQARAIADLDLSSPFGGSMERAAAAVRARTLVAISESDAVVDPEPARQFAALAGATLLVLDGPSGHSAASSESGTLFPAVRLFLESGERPEENRAPAPPRVRLPH